MNPRLSVGTATAESIYEAQFKGKLQATNSTAGNLGKQLCEFELPLPPQIISLTELRISRNSQSSENVSVRNGKLVWRGELGSDIDTFEVAYNAVGKGVYEMAVSPGGILDEYHVQLVANGSDVRMLDLSLQPTSFARTRAESRYDWNYDRLLFGRPVQVDVLGIAPIDRLGELTWLGPLSVVAFGILIGLVIQAMGSDKFDRWMLLLTCLALAFFVVSMLLIPRINARESGFWKLSSPAVVSS